METEYSSESSVPSEASSESISNDGVSSMQGISSEIKMHPLSRPDNPETLEVSNSPEARPGRDDGLTSPTTSSSVKDDSTVAADGRRRIQQTLNQSVETVASSEKTDVVSPPLTLTGLSAMQGNDDIPVSPSIPGYSPTQEAAEPSDWKDLGIVDVPVADLPNPDGVSSPDDFDHHISWEDAKSATLQLPQVQQEVAAGKTGDDFLTEDQATGLDHQHGRKRVYDLYYSNTDPIQVDKDGDQYIINSGRHRIYAAKELGLKTVPARVREKQRLT